MGNIFLGFYGLLSNMGISLTFEVQKQSVGMETIILPSQSSSFTLFRIIPKKSIVISIHQAT